MKFGILGYGNLGRAVASALICTGDVTYRDIFICDISAEALASAESNQFKSYNINDINSMIQDCDVLCLVVKGYVFQELAQNIDKEALLHGKQIISFMAGETIDKLINLLGNDDSGGNSATAPPEEIKIARAMPSLAIAKNEGVIAYTKLPVEIEIIFKKFGIAFEVAPGDIEKVTAFASCGLGFAAYLIDAFKEAGEAMGFPPDTAAQIAAQTFRNACDAGNFRDTVKSVATPGGATEQGILHMDESNIYNIIAQAVQKAYNRMA